LANNTGGVALKSTMGVRNLNLRSSQVGKRVKICLNQSLIYTHLFPLLWLKHFYLPSSDQ